MSCGERSDVYVTCCGHCGQKAMCSGDDVVKALIKQIKELRSFIRRSKS